MEEIKSLTYRVKEAVANTIEKAANLGTKLIEEIKGL